MAPKRACDAFTLRVHINGIDSLLVFNRMDHENMMTHETMNSIVRIQSQR
jgi:hypothetical protein